MDEEYNKIIKENDTNLLKKLIVKLRNENIGYQKCIDHNKKIVDKCNNIIIKNCNHEWILDNGNSSIDKTYMICNKCGEFK